MAAELAKPREGRGAPTHDGAAQGHYIGLENHIGLENRYLNFYGPPGTIRTIPVASRPETR